jgi:tetratricopeptide (TPR) repeat protein
MTTQSKIEIEALETSLAEDPTQAETLSRLAVLYHAQGCFDARAMEIYERAREAHPKDAVIGDALNIAHYLKQLRRFTIGTHQADLLDLQGLQESIDLLRGYLRELDTSPDLFAALGDLYLVKGQVLPAIGAYENAQRHGYKNLHAILQSYEFAENIHTFQPSEHSYFANLYLLTGRSERALEIYRQAVSEGFHDPAVVGELVRLMEEQSQHETNRHVLNNIAMDITELHLKMGNMDAALTQFAKVEFPITQRYELVTQIAAALTERQDYRGAFDYLSRIPVDDDNKQLLNKIAVELEKIGDLDTTEYLLRFINENDLLIREANTLREKEIEIHTELGLADYNASNRRHDQAMRNFTNVLRLGYKQDVFVLSRIVELLPLLKQGHTDDFGFIGRYYLKRGDYYRAAQFFDLVLEHRQDDEDARQKLRFIYSAILEKNPNLPELRLRSGHLYMNSEQTEAAIEEYRYAAQFPETNIEATRRMGIAHMKLKQYTEAMEAFLQMPIGENDLENLYQLHVVMDEKNRTGDAVSLLTLIGEVDGTYRDTAERLSLLKTKLAPGEVRPTSDNRMRNRPLPLHGENRQRRHGNRAQSFRFETQQSRGHEDFTRRPLQ